MEEAEAYARDSRFMQREMHLLLVGTSRAAVRWSVRSAVSPFALSTILVGQLEKESWKFY